jgi:hypothetical protein
VGTGRVGSRLATTIHSVRLAALETGKYPVTPVDAAISVRQLFNRPRGGPIVLESKCKSYGRVLEVFIRLRYQRAAS